MSAMRVRSRKESPVYSHSEELSLAHIRLTAMAWHSSVSYTHLGYGLGFERMIMYLTGIQNIRDVLPFPRTAYGF